MRQEDHTSKKSIKTYNCSDIDSIKDRYNELIQFDNEQKLNMGIEDDSQFPLEVIVGNEEFKNPRLDSIIKKIETEYKNKNLPYLVTLKYDLSYNLMALKQVI